jgi:uncharacterized protein
VYKETARQQASLAAAKSPAAQSETLCKPSRNALEDRQIVTDLARRLRGWIEALARNGRAKPDIRLRIENLTRATELARSVEVADRGFKRSKGLLGRDCLAPGEGLWILPCEAVHTFGMRFSIDLVYLDRRHRVKKVRSDVPPWRMSGCLSAHSVLELAPGTVRKTQTKPGDRLEFSSAELQQSANII